ncbi:hypothetical protein BDY17DRAFT_322477 [Neohortaea acidophila]|uniref:ZZ-type domain-containing protein n=1 Tax=Neohortaea acidophila TaxID=245834 RepID=A0A6A6Q0Z4_9PEZI|nr:uncharacterized protein BDY17DRAFT_322477 [Neohortaea acidophila]KAF2485649.1 hypothetical protein BDY17DRAFT_322477 [Neohortaea acidophila]
MNPSMPMTLAFRPKRTHPGPIEEEEPTLKKQRLETALQTSQAADEAIEKRKHESNYADAARAVDTKPSMQATRVQHDVDGEKIQANTLCWTVFKNSPTQHLLACGHVIDTMIPICCGTRCMLPPGVVVKAEGPAIECMTEKCQNVMKGIQLREARRKNVSIFMPKKKRTSLQRACKPEANVVVDPTDASDMFVKAAEETPEQQRRKARLQANRIIDGTEKLKVGPSRKAADSPFFTLPDREMHADKDKGEKIDPFHASFPEAPVDPQQPDLETEGTRTAAGSKLRTDSDAFACDACHFAVYDFAHHCKTCTDRDFCSSCWPESKCYGRGHDFTVIIIDDVAKQAKALKICRSKESMEGTAEESAESREVKKPVASLADLRKLTRKVAETKKISLVMYGTRQQVKKRLEEARTRGDHERFTRDFPTTAPPSVNPIDLASSSSRLPKAGLGLRRKAAIGDLAGASKLHGNEKKVGLSLEGGKRGNEDTEMMDAE